MELIPDGAPSTHGGTGSETLLLPFESRQFVSACRIASVYCLLSLFINLLGGFHVGILAVLISSMFGLEAMRWKALRQGISSALQWSFALLTSIGLVAAYILNGGLHGSVPLVFLLAVFLALSIAGSHRLRFLIMYVVAAACCVAIEIWAPQLLQVYPNSKIQFADSAIGLFMAMLAIGYGTHQFKSSYDRQRTRVLQRGDQVSRAYSDLQTSSQKLKQVMKRNHEHLHIIAHDLRNPIGAVIGLVEVCREEYELESALSKDLDTIEMAAKQALQLVQQLSEVAYLEERKVVLEVRPTDLTALVQTTVRKFEPKARRKSQQIQTELTPDLVIDIDPTRLVSILDNLVENAIKYSPMDCNIEIVLERQSAAVSLRVCDRGPGIPDEHRSKLFTMFGRVGNRPTGKESSTGLGLYISRMLADLHEAKLQQENRPEGGSEFRLIIPLDAKPT